MERIQQVNQRSKYLTTVNLFVFQLQNVSDLKLIYTNRGIEIIRFLFPRLEDIIECFLPEALPGWLVLLGAESCPDHRLLTGSHLQDVVCCTLCASVPAIYGVFLTWKSANRDVVEL